MFLGPGRDSRAAAPKCKWLYWKISWHCGDNWHCQLMKSLHCVRIQLTAPSPIAVHLPNRTIPNKMQASDLPSHCNVNLLTVGVARSLLPHTPSHSIWTLLSPVVLSSSLRTLCIKCGWKIHIGVEHVDCWGKVKWWWRIVETHRSRRNCNETGEAGS